jgi:hypothetical protein
MAEIKFYGRHKAGSIRDSVLLDLIDSWAEARIRANPNGGSGIAIATPRRWRQCLRGCRKCDPTIFPVGFQRPLV